MALPREEEIASTRAADLESMARLQEDYSAVDAYETCCIMSTEEKVALSKENVVTGAAPRAWLRSGMEIVPGLFIDTTCSIYGLLHGTLDHKTRTARQDKN